MSITIEIDEAVIRAAEQATNIHDPAELVRRLLEREVRLRTAQARLAAAGGTMPDLTLPPRQRSVIEPQ
ncbi:MAG: type II toxin-antitoxin system VapB family antitoxin [Gemmataceae bacterium]